MTKKIIPAIVGTVLAGGMSVAAADVTVFGHLDASLVDTDTGSVDDTNFVCTTCSVGFKGSEDLGNGLKAMFKLDFQFDMFNRNSNGSITDRDQWVGLGGSFGQVVFGTTSTSYKSHGAMLDPGYRTVAQMRDHGIQSVLHSSAGEEGQGRADNTVRWDSPDMGGFKVAAHYTLDSDESDGENDNPYGIGGQYSNGGILVFADYITNDTGGNDDAWKVGGKFSMDTFSVFAQYEADGGLISSKAAGNTNEGADVWMLGGSFTMGNNTVYGAYGQGDDDDAAGDSGYDSWEIVGVHSLSKRTLAYAGYISIEPDASGAQDTEHWTVGMKHTF